MQVDCKPTCELHSECETKQQMIVNRVNTNSSVFSVIFNVFFCQKCQDWFNSFGLNVFEHNITTLFLPPSLPEHNMHMFEHNMHVCLVQLSPSLPSPLPEHKMHVFEHNMHVFGSTPSLSPRIIIEPCLYGVDVQENQQGSHPPKVQD